MNGRLHDVRNCNINPVTGFTRQKSGKVNRIAGGRVTGGGGGCVLVSLLSSRQDGDGYFPAKPLMKDLKLDASMMCVIATLIL